MAFLDYISVCVLHIPHRPKLSVASFSFLNLLLSLPSVLRWYEVERVGWEQVGVVLGNRKYEVGMGYASWEVISTQRMVQVNVAEVNLTTILPEQLKAKEPKVPNLAVVAVVVAGNGSGAHSLMAPLNEPMMVLVVGVYVVNARKGLSDVVGVLKKSVEAVS